MDGRNDQQYKKRLSEAKEKAMRTLTASMKSQQQIVSLLTRAGYEQEIVTEVVAFLKRHRFLDDKALTDSLVRTSLQNRHSSKRQTIQKLMQRGLSNADIRESMQEADEGQEMENALYWGRKKFSSLSSKPLREKMDKTARSLSYRGFSYSVIHRALEQLKKEEGEEEE